jgi:hypothetical protein
MPQIRMNPSKGSGLLMIPMDGVFGKVTTICMKEKEKSGI